MRFRFLVIVLVLVVSATSCISTKQLTYLQELEGASSGNLIPIRKVNEQYRLQTHDLLSIRIKATDQGKVGIFNPVSDGVLNATGEEKLYNDGFVVDIHGNIRIPTLGNLKVIGLTVEEVRIKLEEALLREYLNETSGLFVTVKLAGIRYTINGEIGSPGSKIIPRNQLTIMEAIANSGDISITGDRRDVVIIRQYPLGQKVHHIDLTTIEAMNSPYYYVQPNDLILINPLPQKSLGSGTTGLQSFTTIISVATALVTTILLLTR
jgi:polysaccharide export outer membrane protein